MLAFQASLLIPIPPPTGFKSLLISTNQSKGYKGHEKPLAIVVGLPKSGTTSVYQFFSCSGYRTTHYCCCGSTATEYPCADGKLFGQQLQENLRDGLPLWHGIEQMEIHTQIDGEEFLSGKRGFGDGGPYFLPQHYHLDKLELSAPEAIWILPLRSAGKWKKSVQGWLDMEARFRQTFIKHEGKGDGSSFDLEKFYENHTKIVRDYCRMQRQNPNLCIEINIDQQDAGAILKEYFPRANSSCWGRHNAGPFFQSFPGIPN